MKEIKHVKLEKPATVKVNGQHVDMFPFSLLVEEEDPETGTMWEYQMHGKCVITSKQVIEYSDIPVVFWSDKDIRRNPDWWKVVSEQ